METITAAASSSLLNLDLSSTHAPKWQIAFWCLAPLATNAIIQPSGKVIGLSSKYRPFLRLSPIICLLDLLSALIFLFAAVRKAHIPLVKAVRLLRFQRMQENHGTSSDYIEPGQRDHRDWTRRIFFVVGTMPAAVKLASLTSVPAMQVMGAMYLTSLLVFEAALVSRWRSADNATISDAVGSREVDDMEEIRIQTEKFLEESEVYNRVVLLAAFVCHLAVGVYIMETMWFDHSQSSEMAVFFHRAVVTWVATLSTFFFYLFLGFDIPCQEEFIKAALAADVAN